MGQPVNIYNLAERMIDMAGFIPHKEIEINVTGIRKGERLNEELFAPDEPLVEIGLSGIMASQAKELSAEATQKLFDEITDLALSEDEKQMQQKLLELVPGFKRFVLPKT
jgi:FlaA1/EpsC-like NDP-sugar epimerase